QPAERAVEVRAPHGRRTLDEREAVGGEDERGELASQLFGGAEACAVQDCPLPLVPAQRELDADPGPAPEAVGDDTAGLLADTDDVAVGPRARRETLGAQVQRLDQVRLAGPVRADEQHEPGLERELEPRVGADVPERDRLDDQPARRIGMIRYEKSSPAPVI